MFPSQNRIQLPTARGKTLWIAVNVRDARKCECDVAIFLWEVQRLSVLLHPLPLVHLKESKITVLVYNSAKPVVHNRFSSCGCISAHRLNKLCRGFEVGFDLLWGQDRDVILAKPSPDLSKETRAQNVLV